jgi:uncharacterized protein (TIGR03435 family)
MRFPGLETVRTMHEHLHHPWRRAISSALFVAAAIAVGAQEQGKPPEALTITSYDVVSIRPHSPNQMGTSSGFGWRTGPEGFSGFQIRTQMLIMLAYGLHTPEQIVNLPAWASSDGLDIKAKIDEETAARWRKLSDAEVDRRQLPMMQSLLADRFQLKVHREIRQLPILRLVVAKGGPKLKVALPDARSESEMSNGYISGQATSMQTFVFNLSHEMGRQVIDETGLTDNYDFELRWTPDDQQEAPDAGPTAFTALEEQLGLKLISAKGPVEVIVIDRIERPSEN